MIHIYEGTHSWTEPETYQSPDGPVQVAMSMDVNVAFCGKDDACSGEVEFTDGDRDATCEACLEAYALYLLARDLG